jgi:hypothetical protein
VEDTVFLILEADEDLIATVGLTAVQDELCEHSINQTDEFSADCVVELSPESIKTLFREVQKNLDSLTSICSDGGLDADICFLSDCIRSNGIYVVDWKGDSFVLKSDRHEVCMMLGIDSNSNALQHEKSSADVDNLKKHDVVGGEASSLTPSVVPMNDSSSFSEVSVSACDDHVYYSEISTPPPLDSLEKSSVFNIDTDLENNSGYDSEYLSAFPPNSPALTHVTSTDVQEMIQSGFNSTIDSSITDFITLQDLAVQWKISILGLIYFAERQIITVLSPTLDTFTPDMSGSVTHEWLVRNEDLSVVLSSAQRSLFNILHLSDMFENIADVCLVLSKAHITVINWDEEKYILQSDMEAAMEVCINFEC